MEPSKILSAYGRLAERSPGTLPRSDFKTLQNAMKANSFNSHLKSALHFLFSSPEMPPLNRSAFIRKALYVLLIRGSILFIFDKLLSHLYTKTFTSDSPEELILMALSIFILCFF